MSTDWHPCAECALFVWNTRNPDGIGTCPDGYDTQSQTENAPGSTSPYPSYPYIPRLCRRFVPLEAAA